MKIPLLTLPFRFPKIDHMVRKRIVPYSIDLSVFADDRGVFVPFLPQTYRLPDKRGLFIKRVYYIYNYGRGIIRGFHFHKQEWKYFTTVNGSAKFVAIHPKHPKDIF